MIKKFDKNYVFAKITYLHKQSNSNGGVSISRKSVLHVFDTKNKALKYISESAESKNYVDGKIITYQEALREFGQDDIILAIEMNEAIKNLNR